VKKTPYELWYNRKPSVKNLKVFGCEAFVHVPDEKKRKCDPKSVKAIFLGYSELENSYRLQDIATKKILIMFDLMKTIFYQFTIKK